MALRETPTLEKVVELIAGAGGFEVQSGQSTSPKVVEKQVDFGSAFSAVPKIILTSWSEKLVWITEVTVNYFKWNNNSKNTDVIVDWVAINV